MIVCHCAVVSDRTIHAALADGARTVSAVCGATGAGQDCGTCVFSVKAVICGHVEQETALREADGTAS